jgi:peptidoglycan LD-endopeptidase LytH
LLVADDASNTIWCVNRWPFLNATPTKFVPISAYQPHPVSHLHFGIYTSEGAVDPFPFINPNREAPREVGADTALITKYVRVKTNTALYMEAPRNTANQTPLPKGNIVKINAATDKMYKV